MKEIRKIKEVVSMEYECQDENNNEAKGPQQTPISIKTNLYNHVSEFFQLAVRPLLAPGHESELVYFMQSMGLIQQFMHCTNCDKNMKWTPSRTLDLFQWRCIHCKKKLSIRENSPVGDIKCSFKNILLVLLAWCTNEDVESTVEILDIKKSIVCGLYRLAGDTVDKYMKSNLSFWQIGGPDVVVLVDTFPEGCTNDTRRCNRPILCIAELKELPPTLRLQALERNAKSNDNNQTLQINKRKCLEVIRSIVHPNSVIVARKSSSYCSYDDLKNSGSRFRHLISDEGLSRHDTEHKKLFDNLSVIWNEALDVCRAAQYCHYSLVQSFLLGYMWRRRFKDEAYHHLLNEISCSVR